MELAMAARVKRSPRHHRRELAVTRRDGDAPERRERARR
jgi:hypothetical protein